jgi:1,4-alpha-glucan branching enzyme
MPMPNPSTRPGLGAIPYPGGVTFRTWAPNADSVTVAGEFNDWDINANPMAPEDGGTWSLDLDGAAPGQRYKFVVNGELWRIDPRARMVTNSVGDGIILGDDYPWSSTGYRSPAWDDLVIYEMHAGTFPDNPVAPHRLFDAIARDMPYLRELGVNAIHLLPTGEFPGDDSWGYNPAHIYAVESAYGGPTGLMDLVDAAHAAGIAVIIDVVYNHLGPNDLSVWQYDGWHEDYFGDPMGGIYFYQDWRARTPWGHKNRPDYGRHEVRSYLVDNTRMWLEDYRADGLRFDATNYIRNVDGRDMPADDPTNLGGWGWNVLRWINDEVDRRQPWKLTIAEDMQNNEYITKPTGQGGAGFDTQWDAFFIHTVRRALEAPFDDGRDMGAVRAAIEHGYNGQPLQRVVYTESHDEVAAANGKRRVPDAIAPGDAEGYFARKRSTLGAALVFTSPGIPMIFQGQELLEWRAFGDRERVDWDRYDSFRGIWTLYRDLIRLRRNWLNTTAGLKGPNLNVFHQNDADKVLAFHRWNQGGPGDDVVVVCNFGNQAYPSYTIGVPRAGRWRVRFNSDWQGYCDDFGRVFSYDTDAAWGDRDGLPAHADVGLGPYAAIILSQDR